MRWTPPNRNHPAQTREIDRLATRRILLNDYVSRFVAATRPYQSPESLIVRF